MAIKIKKEALASIGEHTTVQAQTEFGVMWTGTPYGAHQLVSSDPQAANLFVPYLNSLYISVQTANGLKWAKADMTDNGRELFAPNSTNWKVKVTITSNAYDDNEWFPLSTFSGTIASVNGSGGYTIPVNVSVDGVGEYIFEFSDPGPGWSPNDVSISHNYSYLQNPLHIYLQPQTDLKYASASCELSEYCNIIYKHFRFSVAFTDGFGGTMNPGNSWSISLVNINGEVIRTETFTSATSSSTMYCYVGPNPDTQPYRAICNCDGFSSGEVYVNSLQDDYEIWMKPADAIKQTITISGDLSWDGDLDGVTDLHVYVCPDSSAPEAGYESPTRNANFTIYSEDPNFVDSITRDNSSLLIEGYAVDPYFGRRWISVYIPFTEAVRTQNFGHVFWTFSNINLAEWVGPV